MSKRRLLRLNEQFKREIARILQSRVADPRVSGVTVTGVDTTPDLMQARVFVRLPSDDEDERKDTLEGLETAAPWIRRELGSDLHIRRVPELIFEEDRTLEKAMRIEEILREVRPEGGYEDEAEDRVGPEEGSRGDEPGPGDAPA